MNKPFFLLALGLLPLTAFAPEAQALPPELEIGDPVQTPPGTSEALENVTNLVDVRSCDSNIVAPACVIIECTVAPDEIFCTGEICFDSGTGIGPISLGDPQKGIVGAGVDSDLEQDSNGNWGPYTGVFVSLGSAC